MGKHVNALPSVQLMISTPGGRLRAARAKKGTKRRGSAFVSGAGWRPKK
jgi:hypothetical protein